MTEIYRTEGEKMRPVVLKRLIYLDGDYALPFEHKLDLGEPLTPAEQQERDSYAEGRFTIEYEKLRDYLHSRRAVVMSTERIGDKNGRVVYDLQGAILLCWFDRSEFPKIGVRAIPAPESIDGVVRDIEKLFEGKPMRRD